MSLLCCPCRPAPRAPPRAMGAALSHPQEGEACDGGVVVDPPTMADVIRERRKKGGGARLGTLRRLAAAARRPRHDTGCEHARFIRGVVSSWRPAEVALLCAELEAGAALRDLTTQAELAREPAPRLPTDLANALRHRWGCDVEVCGAGWSVRAHRAVLAARSSYFRDLLQTYPSNTMQIPLSGSVAALSRDDFELALRVIYAGAACACQEWDRGLSSENDLDIINVDNTGTCRAASCVCGRGRGDPNLLRRLAATLGFSLDTLHRDISYLLDSGEWSDARLSWCGGPPHALAAHRALLAARSRFFRNVLSRRGAGAVCVDENVLPRRFARALLHAAYTDQVDLSLIGRGPPSPPSASNTATSNTAWSGVVRTGSGGSNNGGGTNGRSNAALEDAFQLYEIARFLEMPIVVQGCEDAVVEALCPDTLPTVLRWAAAPHASQWVLRQAQRYLRDEFPLALGGSSAGGLPRTALCEALRSPFLQASEAQALRALMRWADRAHHNAPVVPATSSPAEPNVVWHTAHRRRRDAAEGGARALLAPLLPLLRTEHLPHNNDQLLQAVRRGLLPPPTTLEEGSTADAWLGRGSYRPARCFIPYLDELKALLEHQAVPEAEVARLRRAKYLHRIPDTLYMVSETRACGTERAGGAEALCVSPRVLAALRARYRQLQDKHTAARALRLHRQDPLPVLRQIALRAVREMSLPDACAELLLSEPDTSDREQGSTENLSPRLERRDRSRAETPWQTNDLASDCCRTLSSSGSLRCVSASSRSVQSSLHIPLDDSRTGTCRRELPSRAAEHSRSSAARLCAAVPDVAHTAPNGNTHLLTARDLARHTHHEFGGGVLQLDLGDGATHTPRPGSRAQRAAQQHAERSIQHRSTQQLALMGCARPRPDEDELRAAIELSVIRAAYSPYGAHANPLLARPRPAPPPAVRDPAPSLAEGFASTARRGSPAPPAAVHSHHLTARRVSSAESRSGAASRSPSPSPRRDYALYRRDYRVDGSYGSSGSGSRGHSPSNYA